MIIDMTVSAMEQKLTKKQIGKPIWTNVGVAVFELDTVHFFTTFANSCAKFELSEWKWENCEYEFDGNIKFNTLPTSTSSTYLVDMSLDKDSPIKWTTNMFRID